MFVRVVARMIKKDDDVHFNTIEPCEPEITNGYTKTVDAASIVRIVKHDTQRVSEAIFGDSFRAVYWEMSQCTVNEHDCAKNCTCPFDALYPLYIIRLTNKKRYVVHPSDRHKVAALLDGTSVTQTFSDHVAGKRARTENQ